VSGPFPLSPEVNFSQIAASLYGELLIEPQDGPSVGPERMRKPHQAGAHCIGELELYLFQMIEMKASGKYSADL
jgi:hypothetical protein